MSAPNEIFPRDEMRPVRGGKLVCTLNCFLPLGRKYHPLLRPLNGSQGLLAIPFGQYRVMKPAAWIKSITSELVLGEDMAIEFEPLKALCQRCTNGHLIDVGANLGLYTLLFRATSPLPIIAYEPQPFLFKLLQWNIAGNELSGVDARNLACGNQRGEVAFSTGLNGSIVAGNSAQASGSNRPDAPSSGGWAAEAQKTLAGGIVNVPVTTLDENLADIEKIAVLKIDCEGYEYQILQGARGLLKRHRPLLFVEVHPEQLVSFGHSTRELLELISPDYELEFWYFQIGRHASKLACSLAKFRRPKAHRCADVAEMLAAAESTPGPAQVYFIGQPRKK
jgi:FkbM family methyltransferase